MTSDDDKPHNDKSVDNRLTSKNVDPSNETPIDDFSAKLVAVQKLAAAMSHNANKAQEHGEAAISPPQGQTVEITDPLSTGSTLTETNASEKTGTGEPTLGFNPLNEALDRVRADPSDRVLTTNQAVPIADNQNSLKSWTSGSDAARRFSNEKCNSSSLSQCDLFKILQ